MTEQLTHTIKRPGPLFDGERGPVGRRRYQSPSVFEEGRFWKIRYWEDAIDKNGNPYRSHPKAIIGPCNGPGALTKKEARQRADEFILRPLNAYAMMPQSVLTVEQFIAQHFQPDVIDRSKKAGECHYNYCMKKILPILRDVRLRDLKPAHAFKLVRALESSGKYSPKTVTHIKVAAVRLWNHAKSLEFVSGDNPFCAVKMPELPETEKIAYTPEQAQKVFEHLESPYWEMVGLCLTTSMNVAEVCGLRLKYINTTDAPVIQAGECIPPFSLLVRWNYYRNEWGTVKAKARRRTLGIPDALIEPIRILMKREHFNTPDHPLFVSRNGTPLDSHNIASRVLRPLEGKKDKNGKPIPEGTVVGMGFPVNWHIFRHTAATMAEAMGMVLSDRIKLMGHASASMTMHYTHSDVERRRETQNKLALVLVKGKKAG